MLKTESRGFVVPPLPEKSFLEAKMARDDFIRLRRADLQVGTARHGLAWLGWDGQSQ